MYSYRSPDDVTPSRATVEAVARATERDPLDLSPLGRTIDTDALDALLADADAGAQLSCNFEYAGCSVTVTAVEVRVDVHDEDG